ncbi:hydroxypyruvate isomerase family protein [Tropicimonas isoalkanivorans]|uniref:Hydroxypyruvate isomerase n=1 Tax=Tropicimonas isoalkanivorans TaxID=441112 RepID=A0A1I1Q5P2_9RHOB|nr:TIM barrel protein [Tropicimonas isoalkanivorans]SFD17282.1 hydroxypyruvate isomerase [Tropicimonas isoalkanivorans]
MTAFSANLGFLWTELPLPDAIRAAKAAGFQAVECHWPYDTPPQEVAVALRETGLPMLGLNTVRGQPGENGLAALPQRQQEARDAIDQAIAYARAIGTPNVHVMAGFAEGADARATFVTNLRYASTQAAPHGITILIEPLNRYDAPGYFLQTSSQAAAILEDVARPNVKLMFDCYHLQIMEGDLTRHLTERLPIIGHIQIASVPDRSEPDCGEVNYPHIYAHLETLGYKTPLGAEYKPRTTTDAGLGWLSAC